MCHRSQAGREQVTSKLVELQQLVVTLQNALTAQAEAAFD